MFHIFLLCSGSAAAANLGVGFLLYNIVGLNGFVGYPISVALAFVSGMGVSFVLNRKFTFPPSGRARRLEMADFTAVSVVGLVLTTVIAQVLRWGMSGTLAAFGAGIIQPDTSAHVIAVGLTAIYSFFAHKYISFRRADAFEQSFEVAPAGIRTKT